MNGIIDYLSKLIYEAIENDNEQFAFCPMSMSEAILDAVIDFYFLHPNIDMGTSPYAQKLIGLAELLVVKGGDNFDSIDSSFDYQTYKMCRRLRKTLMKALNESELSLPAEDKYAEFHLYGVD